MKTILALILTNLAVFGGFAITKNYTPSTTPKLVSSAPAIPQDAKQDPFKVQPTGSGTQESRDVIVLGSRNTLTFRSVVSDESVAKLQKDILSMSENLSEKETIYLVMNTPGGSVDAGNLFIDTAKALPQKVKTLTVFAASMGFHIVENLDERLILPSGTLMSHRAKLGNMGGEIPGEFLVRTRFMLQGLINMDNIAATRMGMNLKDYQEMIRDEYWVQGDDAVKAKAADKAVLARCGKDLMGDHVETFQTFFGPVRVTFSNCPIITGPLDIDLGGLKGFQSDEQRTATVAAIRTLYNQPQEFVRDYVLTEKFEKIFK